jgi:putative Ca2+/H+ antiporter (TMEM165/GDT1 family)
MFSSLVLALIGGPVVGLAIIAAFRFPGTAAIIVAVALSPFILAFIAGMVGELYAEGERRQREDEARRADAARRVIDMLKPR